MSCCKEPFITLKGPDKLRKRPAVYFGSDGPDGAVMVVKKLLDIFVTEAVLGYSSKMDVVIGKDDSIRIRSYDRGLILSESMVADKPAWYMLLCTLYYGADLEDPYAALYGRSERCSRYRAQSYSGFDLCCIQYVSRFMHVEATRDGIKKTLDFERGYSVSDLRKEPSSNPPNTYVHFLTDAEVFEDIKISGSEIAVFLRDASIAAPGLECKLCDERDGSERTFLYPHGAEDLAAELMGPGAMPPFSNEITATGRDRYDSQEYHARVKVVIGFAKAAAKQICLHNFRELKYGGDHLDALKMRLMRYIGLEFKRDLGTADENNGHSRSGFALSFDDIKADVVLILETYCPPNASRFINESRKSIENRMITDMANDLLSGEFREYLKEHHEALYSLLKGAGRDNSGA